MNYFEIGLSFLEGLVLIASPCILPILPLMLGASIDGGKKRPLGLQTLKIPKLQIQKSFFGFGFAKF